MERIQTSFFTDLCKNMKTNTCRMEFFEGEILAKKNAKLIMSLPVKEFSQLLDLVF